MPVVELLKQERVHGKVVPVLITGRDVQTGTRTGGGYRRKTS